MSDSEMKAIWKALAELQARLHKLELHKIRQIDENRAVAKAIDQLTDSMKID